MSACDRLTDRKCQAVARVLYAWGAGMDAAGLQPAKMVKPEDLEAALEFVAEFGTAVPIDVDGEPNQ